MRLGLGLGLFKAGAISAGVRIFSAFQTRVIGDGGTVEAGTCVVNGVNNSSILQRASLLLIPSGYKGGKLYAEIPTNGNGDLTWTRGGDAFRTNESGVLQRVPWNLVQYSEDFSNGVYTKVATTITSNTTNAPNGTLTADKLVSTSVSSSHSVYQNLGSVGDTRVISCFVKKAEYRYVNIQYGTASVRFDFDTLTFSGGTSNSYTDEGGGWYRISCLLTATVNARVTILIPDNSGNVTYTGDDVSGTFIWGFQAVEGTTAQTYLPTTDRLNFPRLDYTYGSCPAVLAEPQRTNLALQSSSFDNASWSKGNSSVTANSTTSPSGVIDADTFTANGSSGTHSLAQSVSVPSGVAYSISFYAKKDTNNFIQLSAASALFGSSFFINYNLDNGVVGSSGGVTNSDITNVGNGWYRCTATATAIGTTTGVIALYLVTSATSPRVESNTLSTSVFLWGAQLEAGAYPTTYIPTTSATATRVADSFSRNNIYTNGLISASGGTWFVELRGNVAMTRDSANECLGIGDSSNTNALLIRNGGGTNRLSVQKRIAGAITILFTTTTDTTKIAIKWNGTSADVFVNGTKQVSATAFTTTIMEFLRGSGDQIPTFIQQMALFPTPLSDTDCAAITSL